MSIVDVIHCMDYLHGLHSRPHGGVCESMGLHGESGHISHRFNKYLSIVTMCALCKSFHGTQFILLSFYGA